MSLLKELIESGSSGSTGAGDIAGARGSLFGGGVVDGSKKPKLNDNIKVSKMPMLRRLITIHQLGEGLGIEPNENNFDPSDVISKLDAAEKKEKGQKAVVAFGLEDEDGRIIKVHVRQEQAEEFENTLSMMLANKEEGEDRYDDDTDVSNTEIAEVLFELKDKFDIIDVDWGTIEGDEEEEQEVDAEGNPEIGAEGEGELDLEAPPGEGDDMEGMEGDLDMDAPTEDDSGDVQSTLNSVIDMMRADAEARKAEADARKAEADAKQEDAAKQSMEAKVKQEEEVLDMEAYYDTKKTEKKEGDQLAKLARWKHEMATESVDVDTEDEEDEDDEDNTSISASELNNLIFTHLRHQQ